MLVHVVWVVVIGLVALGVGGFVGMVWSFRGAHGQHSAYLPAFSAFAVIERVRSGGEIAEEPDWPEYDDLLGEMDRTQRIYPVCSVAPAGIAADDPAAFRYVPAASERTGRHALRETGRHALREGWAF